MHLENQIPIHQVHQFRCAKARATAVGYAMTPRFTGPSENPLREYRVAPGMAMTVGMTMVLPSSHSLKQWGRLCQNGSWGETPVRRCSKPPLDDFPGFGLHTGRRGQIVCDTYLTVNAEMANRQKPTASRISGWIGGQVCIAHFLGKQWVFGCKGISHKNEVSQ